jgi:hypothetical protein
MNSTEALEYAGYIRVPWVKGTILVFSPSEFLRAVGRGKALRRREALRQRQEKSQADATLAEKGDAEVGSFFFGANRG